MCFATDDKKHHSWHCQKCDSTFIVKGFPPKNVAPEDWRIKCCPICAAPYEEMLRLHPLDMTALGYY